MSSNRTIEYKVKVEFLHRVVFTQGVFDSSNLTLSSCFAEAFAGSPAKVLVFLDEGLAFAQPELAAQIVGYFRSIQNHAQLMGEPILVPGGEKAKYDPLIHKNSLEILAGKGLCRHSFVIVVGGGAVIDAVCFAASLVHRGIRQIRIPTTVLGQADAGIGIKNGIDLFNKKNFLGTFYPPYQVINDSLLLRSLSQHEWISGFAEAVKVALIKDPEFFGWIESHASSLFRRDLKLSERLIQRSAELHLEHIATSGDPFERGSARPLDFGHWAAHKLEDLTDFQIGHGHAVAIGICIDSIYSHSIGLLGEFELNRILATLKALGFTLWTDVLFQKNVAGKVQLLAGLEEFREHLGGRLNIPLLKCIGASTNVGTIESEKMLYSLEKLKEFNSLS